jgi:hypothetical protein
MSVFQPVPVVENAGCGLADVPLFSTSASLLLHNIYSHVVHGWLEGHKAPMLAVMLHKNTRVISHDFGLEERRSCGADAKSCGGRCDWAVKSLETCEFYGRFRYTLEHRSLPNTHQLVS